MPKNKFKKSQTHQSQRLRSEGDKEFRGRERLRSEGDKELRGKERLRSEGEKELARTAWARAAWVVCGLGSRGLGLPGSHTMV